MKIIINICICVVILGVGYIYFSGVLDVKKVPEVEMILAIKECQQGDPALLIQYDEDGDYDATVALLCAYEEGIGVNRDRLKVEFYLKRLLKAAKKGNALAQNNLAECYEYGRVVRQNEKQAVELYTKAANQGCIKAQFALGRCYAGGEGVELNLEEGCKWWSLAADQGYAPAQVIMGLRFLEGQGVPQDKKKGARMLTSAAKQENAEALYYLGHCYHAGSGVAVNKLKAEQLWRRSADLGNIEAKEDLLREEQHVDQYKESRGSEGRIYEKVGNTIEG